MSKEAMANEIEEMLNPSNDEVVDTSIADETPIDTASVDTTEVGDVAGEIIADGVGDEVTPGTTDSPSATEVAQAGGEPAAGAEVEGDFIEDIEALRQRIAEMSMPQQPAPVAEGEEEITNPLDLFKDDMAYITEENLAEIADNPILLNAAMNNVRRQTAENILSIVPSMIQQAIQAQTVRTDMHTSFYGKNPELVPYKAYVSSVASEVQTKNADKTQEEILDIVARSVKASLKIVPKKDTTKATKEGATPALRNKSGAARTVKAPVAADSMAAQIEDLL